MVVFAARLAGAETTPAIVEAVDEFSRGNFEEALVLFRRIHAERPTARTHRALAKCYFELRRYTAAIEQSDLSLTSQVEPLDAELRHEIVELRTRAVAFTGFLRIRAPKAPGDAFLVDGVTVRNLDQERLDIGKHSVTWRGAVRSQLREVKIESGQTTDVVWSPESQAAERRPFPWFAVGATAVAAGSLGASLVYFANRRSAFSACDAAVSRGAVCANETGLTREYTLSIVLIPVSTALAAMAVYGLIASLQTPKVQRTSSQGDFFAH
jgi:hypothetical protein